MITATPGDQLVARVWNYDAATILRVAERDFRKMLAEEHPAPFYGVSAYAAPPFVGDEDMEQVMADLIDVTVTNLPGARYVVFTTRNRLETAGFPLQLSEPPAQHYDVLLGDDLSDTQAERLASVFQQEARVKVKKAK